jgi:hypothetical protein
MGERQVGEWDESQLLLGQRWVLKLVLVASVFGVLFGAI